MEHSALRELKHHIFACQSLLKKEFQRTDPNKTGQYLCYSSIFMHIPTYLYALKGLMIHHRSSSNKCNAPRTRC